MGALRREASRATVARMAALVLVLVLPGETRAEPNTKKDWLGKEVVPKSRAFTLRSTDDRPSGKGALICYLVDKVDGSSLFLRGCGISGWASADQVVLADEAVAFFSTQIRLNPGDASSYTMRAMRR